MPSLLSKTVLKKDREALKKLSQSAHIKSHLETLLEEVETWGVMLTLVCLIMGFKS